jgi:hypothetical protein
LHSFAAKQLERLSHRFPSHAGIFHLLAEAEMVFGFWAIVLWWWSWPWWLAAALPCPAFSRNPATTPSQSSFSNAK